MESVTAATADRSSRRRQVELEGYELVQKSVELAMTLREQLRSDELLLKCFRVLGPGDLIPNEFCRSGFRHDYDPEDGWHLMEEAWATDEFVLDPTRVRVHVGRTGMDGDAFKQLLMDR